MSLVMHSLVLFHLIINVLFLKQPQHISFKFQFAPYFQCNNNTQLHRTATLLMLVHTLFLFVSFLALFFVHLCSLRFVLRVFRLILVFFTKSNTALLRISYSLNNFSSSINAIPLYRR